MQVKGLIKNKTREIVTLEADKSVEDAIRLMHSKKISAIIITEKGETTGIFTERDVVRCYVAKDGKKKFKEIPLKEAMTTNLITAKPDDNVGDIMSIMVENSIRHLPVVEDGKVVGMLSIRDVIGL